jgi:hypothetical protein
VTRPIGWETGTPVIGDVTSVFGRSGDVIAQAGDYSVSQITGAAPTASPTFTGTVDADGAVSVLVPLVAADNDSNAAASTAHVKDYLPAPGGAGTVHRSDGVAWVVQKLGSADVTDPTFTTVALGLEALDALALTVAGKVDASGGTLTDGTIDGTTTLDGTATAAGTATIDLDAAASVTVPPRLAADSTAAAASTAHVKAYLPAPGADGTVHRSNGSAWVTTTLGVADVTGAAPLASPALTGTPTAPTAAPGTNTTQIATTEFVADALTSQGALPVDYHPATRLQTVASSAPGFINYLTLNFTAVGGTYAFVITMILSGSSATTQIETNLVIDAVSYGGTKRETGITNGVDIYTGTNSFPFAAGPHTITLQFQHSGGPGTTSCTFSSIQVWKVA